MTVQLDMFDQAKSAHQQEFDAWVNSEVGFETANRFIRIATGFMQRGQKVGAKAIWERLRWNNEVRRNQKARDDEFKLNNNLCSYLARFAMERNPQLCGFFETRKVGKV